MADYHAPQIAFSAPYLAEMVRQEMVKRYGEDAYNDGYKVHTTITKKRQLAAEEALRNNVMAYDMRHGYRGPEKVLWKVGESAWDQTRIINELKNTPNYGPLYPAVITQNDADKATALMADGSNVVLPLAGMKWARPFKSDVLQGECRVASPKWYKTASRCGCARWVMTGGWDKRRTSTPPLCQ